MKILLVEDEDVHAKLTIRSLEKNIKDASVYLIGNGEACLNALKENPQYDLIILDYSLPKLNGLDVMKQIVKMGLDIPVIIVTGHGNEKVAVEAMKLGAFDYIIKTEDYFSRVPYTASDCVERYRLRKERTLLQARLKESEERFRNLFLASSDAIMILDNQFRISSYNPATQSIMGYQEIELSQRFFSTLLENPEEFDAITASLRDKGDVSSKELILVAKNGEKRTTLASFFDIRNDQDQIIGLGCVFKDITERKKAEDRINSLLEETKRKSEELARVNKTLEEYIMGKRLPS
ncbi:MAG: response regulator [bacterium]